MIPGIGRQVTVAAQAELADGDVRRRRRFSGGRPARPLADVAFVKFQHDRLDHVSSPPPPMAMMLLVRTSTLKRKGTNMLLESSASATRRPTPC